MLRTRLFLNLVPFVVILMAVGLYAIVLFSRLAENVDLVVMKNYQSVFAAKTMELNLSRMHGALQTFDGTRPQEREVFKENSQSLSTNLATQIRNAASDPERALTDTLSNGVQRLHQVAARIFEEPDATTRTQLFNEGFYPAMIEIGNSLRSIWELNHTAILQTKEAASRSVEEVTRLMILGMVVALVLASYACVQLGRAILTPIQELTQATQVLGKGDLEKPVRVNSSDELGQLAVAFNTMAAQLHAYRQNTSDQIVRLHRTMETALASFPDPIFVLDQDRKIELRNPSAATLANELGTDTELPAKLLEIADQVFREDRDYLPNSFKAVLQISIKGVEKFFLPRVVRMHGADQEVVGVAVVLYDVTRFRLLDDAKSNLVATVSHELKTPLTGIRMSLHLLGEAHLGKLTPKQMDLVITARNDTERLLRILNDLLDLTRLEDEKPRLSLEVTRPEALVDAAIRQFVDSARSRGVELRSEIFEDVPPVRVDRQRLSHVFSNFISNAIKHSPAGGHIIVKASALEDGSVRFSVVDEGPGVADQHKHRVFDRFYRVPGQSKSGAGLGLSIAREIVLAHGGRIGVHDAGERGSEFFFALPAEPRSPGQQAA